MRFKYFAATVLSASAQNSVAYSNSSIAVIYPNDDFFNIRLDFPINTIEEAMNVVYANREALLSPAVAMSHVFADSVLVTTDGPYTYCLHEDSRFATFRQRGYNPPSTPSPLRPLIEMKPGELYPFEVCTQLLKLQNDIKSTAVQFSGSLEVLHYAADPHTITVKIPGLVHVEVTDIAKKLET